MSNALPAAADWALVMAGDRHGFLRLAIQEIANAPGWMLRGASDTPQAGDIALLYWFEPQDVSGERCLTEFSTLWNKGVRRFLLIAPGAGTRRPWASFPARARLAFDSVCQSVESTVESLSLCIEEMRDVTVEVWAERRVDEALAARRVYQQIRSYAHGSRADFANQFLAPARMLVLANCRLDDQKQAWAKLWGAEGDGLSAVLERLSNFGDCGAELWASSRTIDNWFRTEAAPPSAEELARFMGVLTACRELAGATSRSEGAAQGDPPPPLTSDSDQPSRILVVDDHANEWHPVFKVLQTKLSTLGVEAPEILFSLDGKQTKTVDDRVVPIQFDAFDLIILDVLIHADLDGHALLNQIRGSFAQRPVLLWTTSRDQELIARASRANGVLLKKSLSWDDFVDAVRMWLVEGRRRRTPSLLNPFFNDLIQDEEHRRLALAATDWCLRQLDSFHALDGTYFRYFTDHGGRHISKLLGLFEKVLAPFMLGNHLVLSADRGDRQFELLSLYLTVVCHELGMFPMHVGAKREEFASVGRDYLDDVRSLHALRGMVLFADIEASFWSDESGRQIGRTMRDVKRSSSALTLADAVAVLVGYHARCLISLKDADFLDWSQAWSDGVKRRFERLKATTPTLQRADAPFKDAVERLQLRVAAADEHYRDRLRRQCALFRFIDAIDIDETRNPAEFLVLARGRSATQNRENLKRQVCSSVDIKRVDVTRAGVEVAVRVPCPDRERLRAILGNALPEGLASTPWAQQFRTEVREMQRPLNEWLESVWRLLMGESVSIEEARKLNDLGIVKTSTARSVHLGTLEFIGSVTALAVAAEVVDEFSAIEDAELEDVVCLEEFKWGSSWEGGIPQAVTVLGKPLKEEYGFDVES
ncbi:MAG: response regulator [Vicinamibacterales bacterium]